MDGSHGVLNLLPQFAQYHSFVNISTGDAGTRIKLTAHDTVHH